MHPFLNKFFNILNRNNIKYCVLRNFENLHIKLPDGDIDILIERKDLKSIDRLITNELSCPYFTIKHSNISINYFYLISSDNNLRTLNIEIRTSLCGYDKFGIYEYLDSKKMLENLYKFKNFYIPSEKFYYIHLCHELIVEKKNNYKEKILSLNFNNRDVREIKNHITIKNDLMDLSSDNIKFIKSRKPFFLLKKYILSLKSRIQNLINPKGNFIVFLGPDGSGKTTLCDKFASKHNRSFPSIKRINLANRPIFLKSLFGRRSCESSPNESINDHSKDIVLDFSGKLRNNLRIFYHYLDHILHYYFVIRPMLVRHITVISERYFHDYYCSDKRYLPGVPNLLKKFLLFLLPMPSKIFIINCDFDNILKRKAELTSEQIKYEQGRYLQFESKKNYYQIDNNGTIKDTLTQIEKLLFYRKK